MFSFLKCSKSVVGWLLGLLVAWLVRGWGFFMFKCFTCFNGLHALRVLHDLHVLTRCLVGWLVGWLGLGFFMF